MKHTIHRTRNRKAKKSYTLSPQSVAYLEGLRKRRRAPSVSFVLEEILQAFRRGQEMRALDAAVTNYYTSLSDQEAKEQALWGEFALRQLPEEKV